MRKLLLIVLLALLAIGCVTSASLVKKRYARYGMTPPSQDWIQKSFRGADLFFQHRHQNASIFFSTQCEKFSDSPLEALTAQLLVGFNAIEIEKQERITIAEREALISEITTKIDGVERFLKILVLRKNRCVFDGIFNSSVEAKGLASDFDAMIAHFWAEAEL